jgi:hypothetical protein
MRERERKEINWCAGAKRLETGGCRRDRWVRGFDILYFYLMTS